MFPSGLPELSFTHVGFAIGASGSSFAFLNQGTSGRHGILLPEGPPNVPSVLVGNLLAVRTAVQCCFAKGQRFKQQPNIGFLIYRCF